MGVTIAYDVSGVDHEKTEKGESGLIVPPKGVYTCWVSAIESVEKKNNKDESQLKFTFRVCEGNNKNYPFYDYVDPSAESQAWKLDQLLYALGIDTKSKEAGNFNTDTYVGVGKNKGKKTKVRVSNQPESYTNPTTNTTMETAKVKAVYRYDPTQDEEFVPGDGPGGPSTHDDGSPFDGDPDWTLLGDAADGGDEASAGLLTERAEALGLDPNEYETWAELAAVIVESTVEEEPEPEPAPPVKAAAKKAAPAPAKAATKKAAAVQTPDPQPEEPEEDTDWTELGEFADAEDQDSIDQLTAKAEELGLDPNEYPLWADLAADIVATINEAAIEQSESAPPNYDEMSDDELRAELATRGAKTTGPRAGLILRLRKDDGDPFGPK
jgi:hypothetical protein